MRPWRDIITYNTWLQLVGTLDTSIEYTSDLRKFSQDKKVASALVKDLRSLGHRIRDYHAIRKTELKLLPHRIKALREISKGAARIMKLILANRFQGATPEDFSRRRFDQRNSQGFVKGKASEESLYRNVLTLVNRSLRKAKYLEGLLDFYSREGLSSKDAFLDMLDNYERETDVETTNLVRTVMLEKYDPGHRGWLLESLWRQQQTIRQALSDVGAVAKLQEFRQRNENLHHQINITYYFGKWYEDEDSVPFFLWLEAQPISTSEDKEGMQSSVNYVRSDEGVLPTNRFEKLKVIEFRAGVLYGKRLDRNGDVATVCDTSAYAGKLGAGKAAYVWSLSRDFFIAEHVGHKMHHSTFVSGSTVRCAGMVQIVQGKITYLDTHSGHYKPSEQNLLKFVNYLRQRDAFRSGAKIVVLNKEPIIIP